MSSGGDTRRCHWCGLRAMVIRYDWGRYDVIKDDGSMIRLRTIEDDTITEDNTIEGGVDNTDWGWYDTIEGDTMHMRAMSMIRYDWGRYDWGRYQYDAQYDTIEGTIRLRARLRAMAIQCAPQNGISAGCWDGMMRLCRVDLPISIFSRTKRIDNSFSNILKFNKIKYYICNSK